MKINLIICSFLHLLNWTSDFQIPSLALYHLSYPGSVDGTGLNLLYQTLNDLQRCKNDTKGRIWTTLFFSTCIFLSAADLKFIEYHPRASTLWNISRFNKLPEDMWYLLARILQPGDPFYEFNTAGHVVMHFYTRDSWSKLGTKN